MKIVVPLLSILIISIAFFPLTGVRSFAPVNTDTSLYAHRVMRQSSDGWTQYCHDAQHSSSSESLAPDTSAILWNFSIQDTLAHSYADSPVIDNDQVIIGVTKYHDLYNFSFHLLSLNLTTGEMEWDIPQAVPIHTPIIDRNTLYICAGNITSINVNNGTAEWECPIEGDTSVGSPAFHDGFLYFLASHPDYTATLYSFDPLTKQIVWEYDINEPSQISFYSPAVGDNKVYVSYNNHIYSFNQSSGEPLWNYTSDDYISSPPTYVNGMLFFGTSPFQYPPGDQKLVCVNTTNGNYLWDQPVFGDLYAPPASDGGFIYGVTYAGGHTPPWSTGYLYCFDLTSHQTMWNITVDAGMKRPASIADHKLFIVTEGNPDQGSTLYCYDSFSGDPIWNKTISETFYTDFSPSAPVIADNKLIVGGPSDDLLCFRENTPPDTPAPPEGPSTGKPNQNLCFLATTSDPENDLVFYQFDWGDGNISEWYGPSASNTSVQACHVWLNEGTYLIRVKTKDIYNAETSWSAPLEITLNYTRSLRINYSRIGFVNIPVLLTNTGDVDLYNINWTIRWKSRISPPGGHWVEGSIVKLSVDNTMKISAYPVLGFAWFDIQIEVNAPDIEPMVKKTEGFALFFIIFISIANG